MKKQNCDQPSHRPLSISKAMKRPSWTTTSNFSAAWTLLAVAPCCIYAAARAARGVLKGLRTCSGGEQGGGGLSGDQASQRNSRSESAVSRHTELFPMAFDCSPVRRHRRGIVWPRFQQEGPLASRVKRIGAAAPPTLR